MPILFAMLLALVLHSAMAQAPAEERSHLVTDAQGEAQQRIEFSRRAASQAEGVLKEADAEFQTAQKLFEQARARQEKARKERAEAQAKFAAAQKNYQRDSAELERIRRAQAPR